MLMDLDAAVIVKAASYNELREIVRLATARMAMIDAVELTEEEKVAVAAGRTIHAIKLVRQRVGLGLRDAKDLTEAYRAKLEATGITLPKGY